jgi:hypothetical protein
LKLPHINTTITETNKMVARLQKLVEELKNSKTVSDKEEQELNVIKE